MSNTEPIRRTVTETRPHGVSVETQNGETQVPNNTGSDTSGNMNFILEDTQQNREMFADLLKASGRQEEAANLLGKPFNRSFANRVSNLSTKNVSYAGLVATVVIGTVGFFVSRFLLRKLAQKMNWNILGVNTASTISEEEKKEVKIPNFRVPKPPSQMTASA